MKRLYTLPNKKNGNKKKSPAQKLQNKREKEIKKMRKENKRIKQQIRTYSRNVGRAVGLRAGDMAGNLFGDMYSRVTGFGDYEVTSNTLLAPSVVPDFGPNSVRITHKEYLGNIDGSVGFATQTYPLNPGMSTTFPWLAAIARNYQQYRINGLIFNYVSTSAFALGTTNSALGKVILATNYNAEDPAFTSTVSMLATQFSNYARPADAVAHAIECAPTDTANNVYYVRTDLDGKQKDLRVTDLGFTQISTEGMQSTSEVGGLWITYDITLMKPILNAEAVVSDGFDQFINTTINLELWNSTTEIRNNYLGGTTVSTGDPNEGFCYVFPPQTSTGTYLALVEVSANSDQKITTPAGFVKIQPINSQVLVDDDKNGPFNGSYIGISAGELSNLDKSPYSVQDNVAIVASIIQLTSDNASFFVKNINCTGIGEVVWRLSVFPLSYSNTPQYPDSS